jgi:hypothetical protein
VEQAVIGSSLMTVMDRLALEVLPENSSRAVGNIGTCDMKIVSVKPWMVWSYVL